MADSRDITGKNRKFTGTGGIKLPSGTTAQRVGADGGEIRFNNETNLAEYYTGTVWKSIDAPPTITQFTIDGGADVTSGTINASTGGNATIEVKGSLFDTTGAIITFVGSGETISTQSITRNSANLLTVTVARADFDNANEPYAIKVTNGSGLSAELADAITQDQPLTFDSAAGSLGTFFQNTAVGATAIDASATDPDGEAITYSVTVGSLPAGLSLSSSTGYITGTPTATGSETFTVQAVDGGQTITREFSITISALPSGGTVTTSGSDRIHTFNSSGSFVNTKASLQADVLVVAGGGSGGAGTGGGGGAGGLIYISPYTFQEAATYTTTIGAGGANDDNLIGNSGSNSTLSGGSPATTLTANGGGYGASTESGSIVGNGASGGSGGGASNYDSLNAQRGTATQPANTNDGVTTYNTTGFGNDGGTQNSQHGGGGGGAGGAGAQSTPGNGGAGKQYDISGANAYYAAGGSGGELGTSSTNGIGGYHNAPNGTNGSTNTGSGGGGGWSYGGGIGGNGGSGVIIVRYDPTA
jgi:hypothetical protein